MGVLTGLFSSSIFRTIGIALLCLSLGYMRGCSTGKETGRAEIQAKWNEYKEQIAEDIQNNNAAVIKAQQAALEAQVDLAKVQADRRSKVEREIAVIKEKVINVFSERITNPDCKYTPDELRVSQEAFDRIRNSGRRTPPD